MNVLKLTKQNTMARLIATNCVQTRYIFDASPEDIWKELIFYESMKNKKPLILRLLLPIPIRNEGHILNEGDETLCLYDSGYLRKRLTKIVNNEMYCFEITEQKLPLKLGIKLSGGFYSLKELSSSRTEVIAATNYTSVMFPRWIWKPVEIIVCHWFHNYLLKSINKKIQPE